MITVAPAYIESKEMLNEILKDLLGMAKGV